MWFTWLFHYWGIIKPDFIYHSQTDKNTYRSKQECLEQFSSECHSIQHFHSARVGLPVHCFGVYTAYLPWQNLDPSNKTNKQGVVMTIPIRKCYASYPQRVSSIFALLLMLTIQHLWCAPLKLIFYSLSQKQRILNSVLSNYLKKGKCKYNELHWTNLKLLLFSLLRRCRLCDQTCSLFDTQSGQTGWRRLWAAKDEQTELYSRINTKSRTNVIRITGSVNKVN